MRRLNWRLEHAQADLSRTARHHAASYGRWHRRGPRPLGEPVGPGAAREGPDPGRDEEGPGRLRRATAEEEVARSGGERVGGWCGPFAGDARVAGRRRTAGGGPARLSSR